MIMIMINPDKEKNCALYINMFGEEFYFVRIIVTWTGCTLRLD